MARDRRPGSHSGSQRQRERHNPALGVHYGAKIQKKRFRGQPWNDDLQVGLYRITFFVIFVGCNNEKYKLT
jgi:hypothetical protein